MPTNFKELKILKVEIFKKCVFDQKYFKNKLIYRLILLLKKKKKASKHSIVYKEV